MDNNEAHQVPDHRFQEIQEQLRRMDEENKRLKATLDYQAVQLQRFQQPPQTPPAQAESDFDPKVDQALTKKIKATWEAEAKRMEQMSGALFDQIDEVKFIQKYGYENAAKYLPKVKALKDDAVRKGQWLTHEDAYKFVHFEETNKKPQPKPEPPQAPVFDPYTGKMLEQQAQQPPTQEAPPAYAPPPTQQAQAPKEQAINLPPVATSPQSPSPQQNAPKVQPGSDIKALDAWADKYGDVPI